MYLKRFKIVMNQQLSDKIYSSNFDYRVFFISYYLSQQLKKLKFETDGTFDSMYIEVGVEFTEFKIDRIFKSSEVAIPFDFNFYNNATQTQKYEYYMSLIKEGIEVASHYKSIPKTELLEWLENIAKNNFVYTWDFKNVSIKEYGLKVKFISQLSTNDYILKAFAYKDKDRNPICEGIVIRTLPDSLFFSYVSKKITYNNNKIFINSQFGEEVAFIEVGELLKGNLVVGFSPCLYPENKDAAEVFYDLQNSLRYDNDEFK